MGNYAIYFRSVFMKYYSSIFIFLVGVFLVGSLLVGQLQENPTAAVVADLQKPSVAYFGPIINSIPCVEVSDPIRLFVGDEITGIQTNHGELRLKLLRFFQVSRSPQVFNVEVAVLDASNTVINTAILDVVGQDVDDVLSSNSNLRLIVSTQMTLLDIALHPKPGNTFLEGSAEFSVDVTTCANYLPPREFQAGCFETDAGNDPNLIGLTALFDTTSLLDYNVDHCISSDYLREFHCGTENKIESSIWLCKQCIQQGQISQCFLPLKEIIEDDALWVVANQS
jgi:hypothetical protein